MARLKQIRTIDSLINSVETVLMNRCSLSEEDRDILQKAVNDLRFLKKKKGKTNEEILQVVERIIKIFLD